MKKKVWKSAFACTWKHYLYNFVILKTINGWGFQPHSLISTLLSRSIFTRYEMRPLRWIRIPSCLKQSEWRNILMSLITGLHEIHTNRWMMMYSKSSFSRYALRLVFIATSLLIQIPLGRQLHIQQGLCIC